MKSHSFGAIGLSALLAVAGCSQRQVVAGSETMQAFVGARLIDGTGAAPIDNAILLVDSGVVVAVGSAAAMTIPAGTPTIDVSGRTIIPGLINTHGHAGNVIGLQANNYSRENVLNQLGLYARYGVTTVVSLGDDGPESIQIREEQASPDLDRARIFVAGPVLNPNSPQQAVEMVAQVADAGYDWVKIRIDSNLGATSKMSPEVYTAVIEEAHRRGLPVAVHIIELEDAKGALAAGADFIAHSVRDVLVDDAFVNAMLDRQICYSPTLTRELSTFVYGSRPDFFDDPFFLKEADPQVLETLQQPARQQAQRQSASAQYWEAQLPLARQNLKRLSDAGVIIGMGTDTGPAARFQGYFEHLELEMMAEAGMTPMQILMASTGNAARCVNLEDQVGTLEPGKRADFLVLTADPLEDIRNTRSIESVWINGNEVPGVTR
jgi:imidazolonepropionase-like amidohydrolase